jgi:hypothetical protein
MVVVEWLRSGILCSTVGAALEPGLFPEFLEAEGPLALLTVSEFGSCLVEPLSLLVDQAEVLSKPLLNLPLSEFSLGDRHREELELLSGQHISELAGQLCALFDEELP